MKQNKQSESFLKFLVDFLPIIIFFAVYKLYHHPNPIIPATICLIISSVIALTICYLSTKKIAKMPLISAVLLTFFGGITVFSGNDIFIKMKPTLLNGIFAIILFVGCYRKKPLLDYLFDGAIKMDQEAWLKFSFRWACFFVFLAVLNEIIWRNFSTDFWVQFKVFGMFPLSIAFIAINMPFIVRETAKLEKSS